MILFALILAVSLLLQLFLPWWIIAPVAFGLAFWKSQSARQAFLAGFGAIFVLWIVAALIPDIQNNHILSTKIAELFPVKYPAILMAVTGIIGGLVAGLASWSGYFWKKALNVKPRK